MVSVLSSLFGDAATYFQIAYFAISESIRFIARLPANDFEQMMNPESITVVVLLAHVVAVEALIAPLIMPPTGLSNGKVNGRACGTCVKRLYEQNRGARKYLVWPLEFCTAQEHRFKHGI